MIDAAFSDDLQSVLVTFDQPTNQQAATPCSSLFTPTTVSAFGAQPTCVWQDAKSLVITPSSDATLLPGNILRLVNNSIFDPSGIAASTGFVKVRSPHYPISVSIALQGPSIVGICDGFTIAATLTGNGGRPTRNVWSIVGNNAGTFNQVRNTHHSIVMSRQCVLHHFFISVQCISFYEGTKNITASSFVLNLQALVPTTNYFLLISCLLFFFLF